MKLSIATILLPLAFSMGPAQAGTSPQEIRLPQDTVLQQGVTSTPYGLTLRYQVADNSPAMPADNAANNLAATAPAKPTFQEPWLTLNKTHKYLGVSTILAALATMLTAPGEACEQNCPPPSQQPPRNRTGTHAKLARATVGLATATIFTGVLAHWDDIHWNNGITDPDNLHALLGITGTVLMAKAVNKSAGSTVPVSHAGQAELGALLMAIGIKLEW